VAAFDRVCDEVPLGVRAVPVAARRAPGASTPQSASDQLDEDASLGRPDLEVEVSEEVHSEQPVDTLMIEVEHLEREVRRRYTESEELGYVQPIALFLPDRAVNLG